MIYFCSHYHLAILMRYWVLLLYCLGIVCCGAQTNRALVVTIGSYPTDSGWESIHAANDREVVTSMLMHGHYDEKNIRCLSDEQATRYAVTKALQALWEDVCKDDCVYLHFSCHGQQMMDDNGDEEDGLDEALVMYDAGYWYVKGKYEGENHLRDDELGEWIEKLRKKAGDKGWVTVVLDACHSGTGNRENEAEDYVRGTTAIFAPEGYQPVPGKHPERSRWLKSVKGMAGAVVLSACLPEEINYEYFDKEHSRYIGMLTYAIREILGEPDENLLTVEAIMQELRRKMKSLTVRRKGRKQTPYMECDNVQAKFRWSHKQAESR